MSCKHFAGDELIRMHKGKRIGFFFRNDKLVHKGFDYETWPIINPVGKFDWEKLEAEWGFIPDKWFGKKIDTREKVKQFRNGYVNEKGKFVPGITTLNAMGEELVLQGKIYREAAINGRCIVLSWGFFESRHIPEMGKRGSILKQPYTIPHFIGLD